MLFNTKKVLALLFVAVLATSLVTYVVTKNFSFETVSGKSNFFDVKISPENPKLGVNEQQIFTVTASEGVEPYTYSWSITNVTGPLVDCFVFESHQENADFVFTCATEDVFKITCKIVDAIGATMSVDTLVYDPYTNPNVYMNSFGAPYSYLIETDGLGWYRAISGETGAVSWESTNITSIIQNIDLSYSGFECISLEFMGGTYLFSTGWILDNSYSISGSENFDTTLNYTGSSTAITVGSYSDFTFEYFWAIGGDPFIDFVNSGGTGCNINIQHNKFSSNTVAIKTGESNPFFNIYSNRFSCSNVSIIVEYHTDCIITENYFTADTGITTSQIIINHSVGNSKIYKNTFVGTGSTAPEIIMYANQTTVSIDENKFGSESLANPPQTERILLAETSGASYNFIDFLSISNNRIGNRADSNAVLNFVSWNGTAIEVSFSKINGNIVTSGPNTGYFIAGGTSTNSRDNEANNNIWDFGDIFTGIANGTRYLGDVQGFVFNGNTGFPTHDHGTLQVANGGYITPHLAGTPTSIIFNERWTYGLPYVIGSGTRNATHSQLEVNWTNGTAITVPVYVDWIATYRP